MIELERRVLTAEYDVDTGRRAYQGCQPDRRVPAWRYDNRSIEPDVLEIGRGGNPQHSHRGLRHGLQAQDRWKESLSLEHVIVEIRVCLGPEFDVGYQLDAGVIDERSLEESQ